MWYTIHDESVRVRIFAKPNAKKTAMIAICDDALQITLKAPAQEGKANDELILFFSKLWRIPKKNIELRGEKSRYKVITVPLTSAVQHWINERRTGSHRLKGGE